MTASAAPLAGDRVDRRVGRQHHQRLFDDDDADIELRLQAILASRRRANASGQRGEDIGNIRSALRSVPHDAGNKRLKAVHVD